LFFVAIATQINHNFGERPMQIVHDSSGKKKPMQVVDDGKETKLKKFEGVDVPDQETQDNSEVHKLSMMNRQLNPRQ
jgi:type IV secretory pathway VirB9-like protein